MEQERRRTPRYPFIATAEVLGESMQSRVTARVTELSLHGCYIEMPEPLPKGAAIGVKIYADGKFFEGNGMVVYSTPTGIGVSFHDVRPQFLTILKKWLLAAAVAKYGPKT